METISNTIQINIKQLLGKEAIPQPKNLNKFYVL